MTYFTIFLTLLVSLTQSQSFKEKQLLFVRVRDAYQLKGETVRKLLNTKGLVTTSVQLYIRAFKKEQVIEVWGKDAQKPAFDLLVTYPFCTTSGTLGPKRKEGDLQIPEGIYHINHFNPESNFHLSLGINYPNASDRILSDARQPGGSIYIHGNCVTIGCIPITDDKIQELYLLAVEAKNNGQEKIPVHIFPARLNPGIAEELAYSQPAHLEFWKDLERIYIEFENSRNLKKFLITKRGRYYF